MNRPTPRPPTQSLRAQLAALRAQGWHLSGRAISQIEQHGLNPHLVVRAAAEPTESRPADHVWIKDWSEHQGLTRSLRDAGMVRPVQVGKVGRFESTAYLVKLLFV